MSGHITSTATPTCIVTTIVSHTRKKTPSVSSDCSEATSEASIDSRGEELRPTRVSSRIAGRRRTSPELTATGNLEDSTVRGQKRRQCGVEDTENIEKRLRLTIDTSVGTTVACCKKSDSMQPINTLDDHNYTSPKKTKPIKNNNSSKPEDIVVTLQNTKKRANTPTGIRYML